ncbi:MAG: hypothetical protein ACJA1A_002233 [Saprospiraceae bacterium]|jgi:hypothetical protein|tara:strand:+ start:550 stop:918 length:369 start_codon:yes stop_codon:yes gene_type:complete
MSVVNLDGTHTPAKRGEQALGYQGRMKCMTSNMLILTDKQGVPVGWSAPISCDHHDSFELRKTASKIFDDIEQNSISTQGLFLNTNAVFDVRGFRLFCEQKDIIANIVSIKEEIEVIKMMNI